MSFLRVVEVFPPLFPRRGTGHLPVETKVEEFVKEVRGIRHLADVFLVASVKRLDAFKLSTTEASRILQDRLAVHAAPVLVVRDFNRPQFLSSVLTAVSMGFEWVMLAWGDEYPRASGVSNIRDFSGLSEAIREACSIARHAGAPTRFFAPVTITELSRPSGVERAKKRLRAGAGFLLAQPPTVDAEETFEEHASLLEHAKLRERVLLNVFPFNDETDVRSCEKYFGWRLPKTLHATAKKGGTELLETERQVVARLRRENQPGVYVTTRGTPSVAEKLLA